MDDRQRAENAERIQRKLAENAPLTDIFPKLMLPETYEVVGAEFVATQVFSPHGGTDQRQYVVECKHGRNELTLQDQRPEDDPLVAANMLAALQRRTGCSCVIYAPRKA